MKYSSLGRREYGNQFAQYLRGEWVDVNGRMRHKLSLDFNADMQNGAFRRYSELKLNGEGRVRREFEFEATGLCLFQDVDAEERDFMRGVTTTLGDVAILSSSDSADALAVLNGRLNFDEGQKIGHLSMYDAPTSPTLEISVNTPLGEVFQVATHVNRYLRSAFDVKEGDLQVVFRGDIISGIRPTEGAQRFAVEIIKPYFGKVAEVHPTQEGRFISFPSLSFSTEALREKQPKEWDAMTTERQEQLMALLATERRYPMLITLQDMLKV